MILDFYGIVINFLVGFRKRGLKKLTKIFTELEKEFHKEHVDSSEWHVKGWKTRRLWTPLGDIIIRRRIYERNPKTGKKECKILFDKWVGLIPYLYIQPSFYLMFLKASIKTKSYNALMHIFGFEFSTSTISSIIKKTNVYIKLKKLRDKTPVLILNLDDIFVNQHKRKKNFQRMAIAYTGAKLTDNKKRLKLVNKTLIRINTELPIPEQVEELERVLITIYGEIGKIIIVGDGAQWISTYANYFSTIDTERYIDQYHHTKSVKDLIGSKSKIDWDYLRSLNQDKAIEYILSFLADENGVVELTKTQKQTLRKIKKHHNSYVKCERAGYTNCIEGIQSHFVANYLKYKRAFSIDVQQNILSVVLSEFNGWEMSTDETQGTKLVDLGKQNVKIESLTSSSISNLPILDSGNTETVRIFNTIAHGW